MDQIPSRSATTRSVRTATFRPASSRHYNRVTKDEVRSAGLRRWNGRARITTDWINLFHEPELCFASGDVVIYLREPGQSSRGPAFRVHTSQLQAKGFHKILSKCVNRIPLASTTKCMMTACVGCEMHQPPSELYMPAPASADMETMFDHHITTRNFFAWLYDLPLAGRTLGRSLVALKDRIDFYRPNTNAQTASEVVSFAESQRYLDFRECVDHALAALVLAESVELETLWVDAFTHCVGLSRRGLKHSIEYPTISIENHALIRDARLEMEDRLERINSSMESFFDNDLTVNLLGLPQIARDHFERFRSWLHSYYIEQYGFWPPVGFSDEATQKEFYASMYSDFRNLYHHLVDSKSSSSMSDSLAGSGGVCTLQNVQAFDAQHQYKALPHPLPMFPLEPTAEMRSRSFQRRQSWNPITKRKLERDAKIELRKQALITASNRDWIIMDCLLVRRYSEFEEQTISDELETISMVDGRKVRWLLVYAILQTLISFMQSPKQVRNTEGLSYPLCCQIPNMMPWHQSEPPTPVLETKRLSRIEPDMDFLQHTNSSGDLSDKIPRLPIRSDRRPTLPSRVNSSSSLPSSVSRSTSLRNFLTRRRSSTQTIPQVLKSASFCEILVEGYGNGLNEPTVTNEPSVFPHLDNTDSNTTPKSPRSRIGDSNDQTSSTPTPGSPVSEKVPDLTPSSSPSVSRESSNASNSSSAWSKNSTTTDSQSDKEEEEASIPMKNRPHKPILQLKEMLSLTQIADSEIVLSPTEELRSTSKGLNEVLDEHGFRQTIHINTVTWDRFLGNA